MFQCVNCHAFAKLHVRVRTEGLGSLSDAFLGRLIDEHDCTLKTTIETHFLTLLWWCKSSN